MNVSSERNGGFGGTVLFAALALIARVPVEVVAAPDGTAFTYQGQLKESGAPTNGLHDFRVRLFDAASGGAQVGPTLCVDEVDVVNGLFTLPLDFGQQYATTAQRHLEIQVRRDIGQPCTDDFGYVLLSPRQQLTATPLASHAKAAFALDAADGSPANAVVVDNNGNVGIGTSAPTSKLHVAGALVIDSLGDQADALSLNIERSWVFRQQGTGAGTALKLQSVGGGGNKNFIIETTGNVGIGTTTPAAKLDVRGDIRLGPTGQFRATSGEENLRIVRGVVGADGSILFGTGFTVTHVGPGEYTISFTPPFLGIPTVTATVKLTSSGTAIAQIQGVTVTSATLLLFRRSDGNLVDSEINFIAIGPR